MTTTMWGKNTFAEIMKRRTFKKKPRKFPINLEAAPKIVGTRHEASSITEDSQILISYCMDRVSFCNIYVIQQDTKYLMINFMHNIQ